jgi:hypothetical protein
MNRLLLIAPFAASLAACASQERAEPPAPIVTATTPAAESVQPQTAAPSPPRETVEVYPYRPPSAAPDAAASPDSVSPEAAVPAEIGSISEKATTGPTEATPNANRSAPSAVPSSSGTASAPDQQIIAYVPPPPPVPNLAPAVNALVEQAEQQRQSRDYVGATATLERALGIQPQEPYIWNRLARVRMEQGLYAQAGNLASRSNALAGNQATLKQDNWSIIAAARRAVGDTTGAMEAERKAHGG